VRGTGGRDLERLLKSDCRLCDVPFPVGRVHYCDNREFCLDSQFIRVRGCRVHNLKDLDLDIQRGRLIAICGLSGSGKTSLALDTLYAEGQRRYIESFSAYTRQFLQRLDKPDCDAIEGMPPAIAVTRAGESRTSRSTVGTATEIADHLRLLMSKIGKLFCHRCGRPIIGYDPALAAGDCKQLAPSTRLMIGFDVHLPDRRQAAEILLGLQQEGYLRLIVGDRTFHLSDADRSELAKRVTKKGIDATVIIDRLTADDDLSRITESFESAMAEGNGKATVLTDSTENANSQIDWLQGNGTVQVDDRSWTRAVISREARCNACDIDFPPAVARLFNFNNPLGACPSCEGFGDVVDIDMDLVIPDHNKSLREGAIAPWNSPAYKHELLELLALADDYDLPVDVPFRELKAKHLKLIEKGVPERQFGGLNGFFAWLERKKYKMHIRVLLSRYRSYRRCPECEGKRLKPEALAYRIGDKNMAELSAMRGDQLTNYLSGLSLSDRDRTISTEPLRQILDRLQYLDKVGLSYLQIERTLRTLSGGETQRVALTSALGSALVNMLYVLDEPTAGLHPHDVERLREAIVGLRDRGNTVIVVEHEESMIRGADEVIEIGPGAGEAGGRLVYQGSATKIINCPQSITGDFLAGRRGHTLLERTPRKPRGFITLEGATGHNLQDITVEFPLGVLCLVTGISGSGKSSLVQDTLYGAVRKQLGESADAPLDHRGITGVGQIKQCVLIDQSPISRSPRSSPVTYVKAFDAIRQAFAETVDAKTRNYGAGHFSFNSELGRCAACEGDGQLQVDMQFLADVSMVCPTCQGTRYRQEILQVHFRDQSIADVLGMTVRQAYAFFRGHEQVQVRLKRLIDVGLEYVAIGQPATTLSSGEAQRLKLAAFLASANRKKTLFILDEPSTGLHFADVVRLFDCFDALIVDGHSLIVVEHNLQLIRAADYIIDLGPGAAEQGGRVVATGTPAAVAKVKSSITGQVLRQ
jgi:excinuclease ABC subunit A